MNRETLQEPHMVNYPHARQGDSVDRFHGVDVKDPFRWLEESGSEQSAWIEAQRRLLERYLPPSADIVKVRDRLDSYAPDVENGAPFRHGKRTFFMRAYKGKNYPQIIELNADGSERSIIDPNTWSDDGAVAPAGRKISPQGNYVAVARSAKGNDHQEWSIIDIATAETLVDTLPQTISASPAWLKDESGFFYEYTLEDGRRGIFFHELGTAKEEDASYFTPKEGDRSWYGRGLSRDDRFMYVYRWPTSGPNSIDIIDLSSKDKEPAPFIRDSQEDSFTIVLANEGNRHIVMTKDGAPKGMIVAVTPGKAREEIVPPHEHVLTDADVVAGRIAATYYTGTRSYLKIFDMTGTLLDTIDPPDEVGTVSFHYQEPDNPDCYVYMQSPIRPTTTMSYNIASNELKLYQESGYNVDSDNFEVALEYAVSKDGTHVPMFVCKAKDTVYDGSNPTILYGYGGFGITIEPSFDESIFPWLEAGGVYASACLRGGGEFGTEWHEAGKKLNKQNVFDDYIACAETLVATGVTSPDKLVLEGGSNGGLLVGATLLQRPDLMRVVIPDAGLLDMMRYDKDEHAKTGIHWQSEYGTTDSEEDFKNLLSYSPVHNIVPGRYPIVYATVGEDDDRVLPSNTYKFIAGLQAAQRSPNPILVDIQSSSGHSLSGRERRMLRTAKEYAFLFKTLGMGI